MKKILWTLGQILTTFLITAALLTAIKRSSHATDFHTLENDFTPMQFSAISSATSSTYSVTGVLTYYKVFVSTPNGSTLSPAVSFHINFTTVTFKTVTGIVISTPVISSSETFVPPNQIWDGYWQIAGYNPQFVFSNLTANATLYFMEEYGQEPTR